MMIATIIGTSISVTGVIAMGLKPSLLEGFMEEMKLKAETLVPGAQLTLLVPKLSDGQILVIAPAPYIGDIKPEAGISKKSLAEIQSDMNSDVGGSRTILYLLEDGEVKDRSQVHSCDLRVFSTRAVVLRPPDRTLVLEGASSVQGCEERKAERWNQRGTTAVLKFSRE